MSGWPEGVARIVLEEAGSTNDEAGARALAGEGPAWIMARRQTAARGRQGRAWSAPKGNLSASLLMVPEVPLAEAATFSFDAALAVADLADAHGAREVGLKWPNDVLVGGRKVAGILLESLETPRGRCLIVGVGVNLAHAPEETRLPAATLGAGIDPEAALDTLAAAFARWQAVRAREGFAAIRTAWLARAAGLGQPIEVRLPRETLAGTFEDVDADGCLVLRTAAGPRRIAAGDVFLAPAE